MRTRRRGYITLVGWLLTATWLLTSCFTGVEGTKRIELTRQEKRDNLPTPEERLFDSLPSYMLGNWQRGKQFRVTDSRLGLMLEQRSGFHCDSLRGEILTFDAVEPRRMPDGTAHMLLLLRHGAELYALPTGKKFVEADTALSSLDLPMLVDLDYVADADRLLRGRTVWTLSPLWYDAEGNKIDGLRYSKARIKSVSPGDKTFPLKVEITTDDGLTAFLMMNYGKSVYDSRPFAAIFSLTDPRLRYPSVTDAVWDNIRHSRVAIGMTKDECRLALGPPSDVNSGHDYSRTLDIWQYSEGVYLRFADGVLVDFRR